MDQPDPKIASWISSPNATLKDFHIYINLKPPKCARSIEDFGIAPIAIFDDDLELSSR